MSRERFFETPRFLPDGTAVFPKKGMDPPPDMEGYQRRSGNPRSGDAWVFIPLWSACPHRSQRFVQRESGCRCVRIVMFCNHSDGKSEPLTLACCQNCTLRQPHQQESFVESSGGDSISESIMVSSESNTEPIAQSPQPEAGERDLLTPENSPVIEA